MSYASAWSLWWELNREHLRGLRMSLASRDTVTEGGGDPRVAARSRALPVLRKIAIGNGPASLRASALTALGRAGTEGDARILLEILRSGNRPHTVYEGAALGLANLEEISDPGLRADFRALYKALLEGSTSLPERARLLGILAGSLRTRDDPALARMLGLRCRRPMKSAGETSALLLSCGLARDDFLASEVLGAVTTGRLGTRNLQDVSRSHAVLGLALTRRPEAISALARLVETDGAPIHTRRSAVIGLGLLLRDGLADDEHRAAAEKALMHAFTRSRDPLTQGFAAMGMGTARTPVGIPALVKSVDKTGPAAVRPFAALALGLASQRVPENEGARLRRFLVRELEKTRNIHLAGALAISVGVAGAEEGRDLLLARARSSRHFTNMRAYALEALGLLGDRSPEVMEVLLEAIESESPVVVQNAAVALGFLGDRETVALLVRKLTEAPWEGVQMHMVVGLSHLGGTSAVAPLLEVIASSDAKTAVRRSAATVVGILLDRRERDPLFEIDACCNPYALTDATRELVRTY